MQAGSVPVRRRGRIVPAAVALLVGSWLLAAAPAAAHALVVGSNPQAGARIARAPAELRVAFSEAVRPLGPGLTLQGPSGGQVRLGSVRHPDGRPEVLAATLPTLGDGSYLAGWRIVSADDGHLEAGSFAFAVGTGSGPVTSPAPSQLPTPWQVAGRWLETAGVLGLVGVVVAALAIWHRPEPIGPDEPRWWALTVAAAAVGAVGLAWQVAAVLALARSPWRPARSSRWRSGRTTPASPRAGCSFPWRSCTCWRSAPGSGGWSCWRSPPAEPSWRRCAASRSWPCAPCWWSRSPAPGRAWPRCPAGPRSSTPTTAVCWPSRPQRSWPCWAWQLWSASGCCHAPAPAGRPGRPLAGCAAS